MAQNTTIKMSDCIDKALINKANIKASGAETIIAALQNSEAKGKYMPQISIAYHFQSLV